MAKELDIPKLYYYTVEGVVDSKETPRRFSIASLSRDIYDEFDLEGISGSAALMFFLENIEYQDETKWPLTFKFLGAGNPVELEMNLSYAPCFLSTPRKITIEKKENNEVVTETIEKKPRKTRTKKENLPTKSVETYNEVLAFMEDYHGFLVLSDEPFIKTRYGASLPSLEAIADLLATVKSLSEEHEPLITIKYKEECFNVKISSEFYHLLTPEYLFDPSFSDTNSLTETPLQEIDNDD